MRNNMTASGAVIPSDINPGKYILRHEMIALHFGNGNNPNGGGAELYPECMDVEVTTSSGNALPEGVKFPGAYKAADPGIRYNLYFGPNQYVCIGAPPRQLLMSNSLTWLRLLPALTSTVLQIRSPQPALVPSFKQDTPIQRAPSQTEFKTASSASSMEFSLVALRLACSNGMSLAPRKILALPKHQP